MAASFHQRFYPEIGAGGFSRIDGTVAVYKRVNALLTKEAVLLDYGAGRGGCLRITTFPSQFSVENRQCVIGVDVDEAVMQNPALDEAYVFNPKGPLPIGDASIDIIVSDVTFEHIVAPAQAARELDRVLKPGGWLCVRTPNRYGYIALADRFVPKAIKTRVLNIVQPSPKEEDVFPAVYLMNSFDALLQCFPSDRFEHFSYTWDPEPAYHATKKTLYRFFQIIQYITPHITPPALRSMLMVSIRKRL